MLSPNDLSPKTSAPSIWSLDSGYGSNSVLEEEGVLQLSHAGQSNEAPQSQYPPVGLGLEALQDQQYKQDGCGFWSLGDHIQLKRKQPAIDPIITRLSVFTTKDAAGNAFYLPELSNERESCIECDLWKITNPGEDVKCPKCRLPEIIEPASAFSGEASSNVKEPLPRLDIPADSQRKSQPGDFQAATRRNTRCSACELSTVNEPSGSKFCPHCSPDPSHLSPFSPSSPQHTIRRSRAGRNSKLPLSALNCLQAWLDANQDNPYPSAETKRLLAQECGITEKQVTTWFTNARARQLNPLDTQLSSGSEDEEGKENDVAEPAETPTYNTGGFTYISDNTAVGQQRRDCATSLSAAFSPTQARARPSRRGKKKDYRRNNPNTLSPQTPTLASPTSPVDQPQTDQEMWQCTFCRKAMVPKSWRRHEETQHRPKAQWTCMLHGPRLSFPARSDSSSVCAFCMMKNPSEEHFLHHHRIQDCAKRDITDRTFFRPDHLRQHVKNFHNASLFDIVQARWKRAAESGSEGWMCGFCGEKLDTWDKRESHIANHFKDGLTMASWRDYPNVEQTKAKSKSRQGKGKEKERPHGLARLRNFGRRSTRQSHSSSNVYHPNPQSQPHLQNPAQEQQSSFANAFEPLPTSLSLGLGISQAPILPNIPSISPLIDVTGNYVDWNTAIHTPMEPQVQYQLPPTNNNLFDPSIENATLQQEFDNALNMDLYSDPIEYQGPWDQQQYQHQHPHQHPQ